LIHYAWQQRIRGDVALPKTEKAAHDLLTSVKERVESLTAKANELARSRTSDERKAMDISRLLIYWMMNGKPGRPSD